MGQLLVFSREEHKVHTRLIRQSPGKSRFPTVQQWTVHVYGACWRQEQSIFKTTKEQYCQTGLVKGGLVGQVLLSIKPPNVACLVKYLPSSPCLFHCAVLSGTTQSLKGNSPRLSPYSSYLLLPLSFYRWAIPVMTSNHLLEYVQFIWMNRARACMCSRKRSQTKCFLITFIVHSNTCLPLSVYYYPVSWYLTYKKSQSCYFAITLIFSHTFINMWDYWKIFFENGMRVRGQRLPEVWQCVRPDIGYILFLITEPLWPLPFLLTAGHLYVPLGDARHLVKPFEMMVIARFL